MDVLFDPCFVSKPIFSYVYKLLKIVSNDFLISKRPCFAILQLKGRYLYNVSELPWRILSNELRAFNDRITTQHYYSCEFISMLSG